MEQIYTIPVNEAFEASRDDHTCGCPMCSLFNKLENNELEDTISNMGTLQGIKDLAGKLLGLVDPDTVIILPEQ